MALDAVAVDNVDTGCSDGLWCSDAVGFGSQVLDAVAVGTSYSDELRDDIGCSAWQLFVLATMGFVIAELDAATVGTGCEGVWFGAIGCSGSGWYVFSGIAFSGVGGSCNWYWLH